MTRRSWALLGLLALADVVLGWKAIEMPSTGHPNPAVTVVKLPSGKTVTCVIYEDSVTCDFLGWAK